MQILKETLKPPVNSDSNTESEIQDGSTTDSESEAAEASILLLYDRNCTLVQVAEGLPLASVIETNILEVIEKVTPLLPRFFGTDLILNGNNNT